MYEEKKAREFHATPLPRSLYKKDNTSTSTSTNNGSMGSSSSGRYQSTDNICPQFKAREATVLKKSPFIPTISKRPAIKVVPFQLETESRRVEREEFDKEMKLREEHLEWQRQHIKQLEAEEEEKERQRCRKLAEYRANPIRKYKPVEVKSSNRVTHPITPRLNKKKSWEDKENVDDQNK